MEQTVYGDLLFFVNFCMAFQCLFLTAKLLRRPFCVWRGVLFSAMGALYAVAALFISVTGGVAFFSDLLICFLMCVGVFWGTGAGILRILIPFGLYFGVSMAVGGVMSGMASLLSRLNIPPAQDGEGASSLSFFLLAALGGAATFLWGRLCQRRAAGSCVRLTLCFLGRALCVEGMVDTANLLCDPVGGRPVVILDRRTAEKWLPRELSAAVEAGPAGIASLSGELARRVRMIPAQTVTGGGLLLAVQPDSALLDSGGGARAVELLIAPVPLSSASVHCEALVPPALLTE